MTDRTWPAVDRRQSNPIFGDRKLKLGTFQTNLDSACIMSSLEDRHHITWPNTVACAKLADEMEFEAIVPVARWRLDGVTYIIDQSGARIAAEGSAFPDLPLVVGDEAGDDAMGMLKALAQFPAIKKGLVALSRIGDRRWDMIYKSGLRVQLPEQGVAQALRQLDVLEQKFQILARDVTIVDLRVAGMVAVKPTDEAARQLAAIAKANIAKNKGNFKQDADYSAPAGR